MGPHGPELLAYDLVRTVLRDDRFAMPKGLALAAQGITSGELWDISLKGLLSLDGEAHHRQRRLVSKAFTPRAAERLRATCADVITELVDTHAERRPLRCRRRHRQAVPDPDHLRDARYAIARTGTCSRRWADDIFKVFDWNVVNDEPDIMRAWRALERYLDDMVTSRRDTLTDDLLSDMMRAEVDGDRLTHDELLTLAATLLMAGTDTTRNQLAAAVQVFCEHPDQWALLAEHPELAPRQSHEVMRYSPVIFTTMRIAGRGRRTRRRQDSGGHARHREYRCGQPRPRSLPRSRSLRHHPRRQHPQC